LKKCFYFNTLKLHYNTIYNDRKKIDEAKKTERTKNEKEK